MTKIFPFFSFLFVLILLTAFSAIKDIRIQGAFLFLIGSYWIYRNVVFVLGTYLGLKKYQRKIESKETGSTKHLLAIASFNESLPILEASLNSILSQDYDLDKVFISISVEERNPECGNIINQLSEFLIRKDFHNFIVDSHPSNLEGEVPGASSNKKWAAQKGIQQMRNKGINLDSTLVTIPDADTIFDKNYLLHLSKSFENNRQDKFFFQPQIYKIANNIEKMRYISKVVSLTLTQSIVASSNWLGGTRYTFSCFSIKASTLEGMNYWDTTTPIDDTPFYWRLMNYLGTFPKCINVNSGINVCGITGNNVIDSSRRQYLQLYRWGWGVSTMWYGFKSILKADVDPISKVIGLIRILDRFIVIKLMPIIISCGFLMSTNISDSFWNIVIAFNAVLIILEILIISRLIKLINYKSSIKDFFLSIVTFPAAILVLTFYGFVPYFHAAFDMIKGRQSYNSIVWTRKR